MLHSASSIGLLKPCCCDAFNHPYRNTFSEWFPSQQMVSLTVTFPAVNVPVLSEQSIFMLPKLGIEDNFFTITFFRAILFAPVARFTEIITGNNCGVNPTASANEKR